MRVAYVGHEALTFSDYMDTESGKTLYAEPGRVYDITPASGRTVPGVPEPWFIAIDDGAWNGARAALDEAFRAMETAQAEPQPEAEAEQDPAEG